MTKQKRTGSKPRAASKQIPVSVSGSSRSARSKLLGPAVLVTLVLIGLVSLLVWRSNALRSPVTFSGSVPAYVGSETCAACHMPQAELWRASQHKHAMAHATEQSVLGNFDDARFEYFGSISRFFRQDGKFMVETDGPDGVSTVFEIKYTFGLDPLQQYLIEFPDGRVQALSIAWDSRPKEKGGQRWFHLYPNERIAHNDPLHWTKRNQNWNFMCAECHSTGVRRNYNANSDTFKTTFAEISVGCETCHGQGSRHVTWAKDKNSWWPTGQKDDPALGLLVRFAERLTVSWPIDPNTGSAKRSAPPASLRKEVETCGLCHARRGQFSEEWKPGRWLSDTHNVSPLARGLYHADGQMLDEVFNYGSFKQSKMFAAGVTCSDCHDPHSGKLRAAGDNVCLQCHMSDKFAAPTHHRHAEVKPALTCASCHMPVRNYMIVDSRHDHSFRVPRPDLSTDTGTPNACNDCHKDKTAQWAATTIEGWHGALRKGFQTYAPAFHAAWADKSDATKLLAAIAGNASVPGIARATAFNELATRMSPDLIALARRGLSNADPMVKIGAIDMLEHVPVAQIWAMVSPLLTDPVQGVRIRAAQLLAGIPAGQLPAADRIRFQDAAAEFVAAQRLNADRPEARSLLGTFYARRGLLPDAESEFKAALKLDPQFAPGAVNLADLYRQMGRDADGEHILRQALSASTRNAALTHALGLALARLKRIDEAISALREAAEIEPGEARYGYVYAVALNSAGRTGEAVLTLRQNVARHPRDRTTLMALISLSQKTGDIPSALKYAEQMSRVFPGDTELAAWIRKIKQKPINPGPSPAKP